MQFLCYHYKINQGDSSLCVPQCRQLVAVCDEILNSSPETLLTHTAQLESVDLVPVSPGDQLVRPVCYLLMCSLLTSTLILLPLKTHKNEMKKKSLLPEAQTNKDLIGWLAVSQNKACLLNNSLLLERLSFISFRY